MSIREFRTVTEFIALAFVAGFLLGGAVLRAADDVETAVTVEEKTDTSEATTAENAEPRSDSPLLVRPRTEIVVPPGRPEWVEQLSTHKFEGTDQTIVCSDPFKSAAECKERLNQKIDEAVQDYIVEHTHSKMAPRLLNNALTDEHDRLVPQVTYYEETIISPSVGKMEQIHARVQFDTSFREKLDDRWLQMRSKYRLGQIGLGFAAVLGVLATISGYFRADNASRGYYTGRLQWLAGGAILALIVLGAFFARLIPWV